MNLKKKRLYLNLFFREGGVVLLYLLYMVYNINHMLFIELEKKWL